MELGRVGLGYVQSFELALVSDTDNFFSSRTSEAICFGRIPTVTAVSWEGKLPQKLAADYRSSCTGELKNLYEMD